MKMIIEVEKCYYTAIDFENKLYFEPPYHFESKTPEIYHPDNPFPNMLIMMLSRGYKFSLQTDFFYIDRINEYTNITYSVLNELLEEFPFLKGKYAKLALRHPQSP